MTIDRRRLALILRPVPPALVAMTDDEVRGYYYRRLWDGWRAPDRATAVALAALRRPAAMAASRRLGPRALEAWRLGFTPDSLAEIDARLRPDARPAAFLDQQERKGLHALINPGALPFDGSPLKNKQRFAAYCAAHALPAAAIVERGACDAMIVKPQYGSKGRGVRRVERSGGDWRTNDGQQISGDAIERWLTAQRARGMIVQVLLRTDPALLPLSPGALPTLRITTCLDERGCPEAVDVALRLSMAGERAADNFNADNLVCAVDPATARIGAALRRTPAGFVELVDHPVSGERIVGRRLPGLAEATALAIRAHAPLAAGFAVIGWDIGLTDSGPALVEGNWNPGYNVMQLVHGRDVGEMRLGALYQYHLEKLPDAAWRRAAPIAVAQRPA